MLKDYNEEIIENLNRVGIEDFEEDDIQVKESQE